MNVRVYAKAIVAGTVTFCSTLGVALPDGVSAGEWCAIVPATILAVGAVFGVTNEPQD